MNPLTIVARRFVAGEQPQDAVRAGERLHAKGIKTTFDKLGEDVNDREAAARATEASKQLLRLIPAGIERNISIKMSSMGQRISRELCLENVAGILDCAKSVGGFVRLDMEGSKLTQDTVEVFQLLRKTHDNVGLVLQAMLHRTPDDVREAIRRGDRIRLCKGAYREPPQVALQDMAAIRNQYAACAHLLLDSGNLPAIATHDEHLIGDSIAYAQAQKIAASRFEFQMLYGLRRSRWDSLVADRKSVV
jgi:proline dehydrogenase